MPMKFVSLASLLASAESASAAKGASWPLVCEPGFDVNVCKASCPDDTFSEMSPSANPFNGIDVGHAAAPVFQDVNGDGHADLVVGNYNGNLKVLLNSGSNTWPTQATGNANPFNGIDVGMSAKPAFQDVNGDGHADLVVGNSDGKLKVWLHSGSNTWPTEATGNANPFNGIDVGGYASPAFQDVNGDGHADLVVGNVNGNLKVWLNSGTNTWPTEATGNANPFNGIDAGMVALPTFYDVNNDGNAEVVVGELHGKIKVFQPSNPCKDTCDVACNLSGLELVAVISELKAAKECKAKSPNYKAPVSDPECNPKNCDEWSCDTWCKCYNADDDAIYERLGCAADDEEMCQC